MGFLHFLDVAIGFALGMMVLATLVGTFSGVWLSAIRSRTRQVRTGLASLVHTLGSVTGEESTTVAEAMLSDYMVKARTLGRRLENPAGWRGWLQDFIRFVRGFSAETIRREEFALLLLRKAGEGHAESLKAVKMTAEEAKDVLARIERTILAQEAQSPHLPAQVWRTRALNQHASDVASRLFSQFDNVMDRIEDNVAFSAKAVAVIFSAIFLSWFPVDSLGMIDRLSKDEKLRAGAVEQASKASDAATVEAVKSTSLFNMDFDKPQAWNPGSLFQPGVLLTWIMVSLGAPFWLGLLDNLLGVRSEVARKASEQRSVREGDQSVRPPAASTP